MPEKMLLLQGRNPIKDIANKGFSLFFQDLKRRDLLLGVDAHQSFPLSVVARSSAI